MIFMKAFYEQPIISKAGHNIHSFFAKFHFMNTKTRK